MVVGNDPLACSLFTNLGLQSLKVDDPCAGAAVLQGLLQNTIEHLTS